MTLTLERQRILPAARSRRKTARPALRKPGLAVYAIWIVAALAAAALLALTTLSILWALAVMKAPLIAGL